MLAVIASVREEVAPLLRAGDFEPVPGPEGTLAHRGELAVGRPALVLAAGVGQSRAEEATAWVARTLRPDLVMSVGFGGGTRDSIQTGTVVIATKVSVLEGTPLEWSLPIEPQSFESDRAFAAKARMAVEVEGIDFVQGPVITVPIVAKSPGLKRWLGRRFGVYSVDLESYWVARAAVASGLPFLGVRVVVDTSEMTLPDLVTQISGSASGGRAGKALGYAARDPRRVAGLARLGIASSKAANQLAAFLSAFARELAPVAGSRETAA